MLNARGQWVLFSDADLSTPIEEVEKLADAARNNGAAVVIGSRALDRSLIAVRQTWGRESLGRLFNLAVRVLTGLPFHDTQCGFKLYRSDAAQSIFSRQRLDGFSFDVEDLMIARCLRLPVLEVPVQWSNVAGTKVTGFSGLRSFIDLLRIRTNQMSGEYR
jgi:dolichyl-phosphate beta-glucosyltransferase